MNRQQHIKYIVKTINLLSLEGKYIVAKILLFKEIDIKQSNNGVYCLLDKIDDTTMHEVYNFIYARLKP